MNLLHLAAKYKTDKLEHGYIPFYEKHLPKNPKRILEIGVKQGASLAMWAEYFPETQIYGLDLFEENNLMDVRFNLMEQLGDELLLNDRVVLHKGNQCDWQILEELRKYDFDVIIDDGSHNARDQMITFFGLFNGRHYFIEDLHCNHDEFYSQGLPFDFSATGVFQTLSANNAEYGDNPDDIIFQKVDFNYPYKIVCIYASEFIESSKNLQP